MPIAQRLHPALTGNVDDAHQFDLAGLAQYVTVGGYILFFATYSVDMILLFPDAAKEKEINDKAD
jgi:hypothetical protein